MNPYAFTEKYADCYLNRQMAMDARHVYLMHDILKAWPFKNALELGSWYGASSTAFVEAINAGLPMTATFCDVQLTSSLRNVASNCKTPGRVRLTSEPSWNVLESAEDFDFVLVDAGHTLESVLPELHRLVVRKPLCVMAHDTNATAAGYPKAEGAELLKRAFDLMPGYSCVEDRQRREGEQTERGLFFATSSPELFALAESVFNKWA